MGGRSLWLQRGWGGRFVVGVGVGGGGGAGRRVAMDGGVEGMPLRFRGTKAGGVLKACICRVQLVSPQHGG